MKTLIGGLIGVVAIVMACVSSAGAAKADVVTPEEQVVCTDALAQWSWSLGETSGQAHTVAVPPGTDTRIFACKVGRHAIRMNSGLSPYPLSHCSATTQGRISVWVDGVKVVDKRDFGDFLICQSPGQVTTLYRLSIDNHLKLTLCTGDVIGGKTQTPCQVTQLRPERKLRDARYDGDVVRTAPGLEPRGPSQGVCSGLTAELAAAPGQSDDPVYKAHGVSGLFTSFGAGAGAHDFPKSDVTQIFVADVDNDGVPDQVTYHYEQNFRDIPGQLSWRSGASKKAVALTPETLRLAQLPNFADAETDFLAFVRVDGKVYLYETDMGIVAAMPDLDTAYEEAAGGAQPDAGQITTRRLYALTPDGKITQACAWGPKPRPEELL